MPVDPDSVNAPPGPPTERSWTSADALLYAIGVGAGAEDPSGTELQFTTENSTGIAQRVLPTFAVILGAVSREEGPDIGTYDPGMRVHGEQVIELHGEIPPAGTARTTSRVAGVYDKGSGALVVIESRSVDADTGAPLLTSRSSSFIRGEGGFGGDRGPSGPGNPQPDRDPDIVITYQTRVDQALIYRLSGDRNPLHSDPVFARNASFPKPILHGLCTYGFAGRALLHALCGSDPARFKTMEGRFSKPVFPGDTLTVRIWTDGHEAAFSVSTQNGETVIDRGRCTFSD